MFYSLVPVFTSGITGRESNVPNDLEFGLTPTLRRSRSRTPSGYRCPRSGRPNRRRPRWKEGPPPALPPATRNPRTMSRTVAAPRSSTRNWRACTSSAWPPGFWTLHPQTLRKYERLGLINPGRTVGMLRLYSQEDIRKVFLIRHLMENLGLNLAGVEFCPEPGGKFAGFQAVPEERFRRYRRRARD